MSENQTFRFKKFEIEQSDCLMKVGTDGILLGAWADTKNSQRILDIGSGTGLIALMIAQRTNDASIDAVEIAQDACNQAQDNFEKSIWASRLTAHNISIQDFTQTTKDNYDLVVCNPPFFSGGTLSSNTDKNSVRHTIKLSHIDLLRAVRSLLAPNGNFCVVLPHIEGLRFIEMAETYGFSCNHKTEVKSRPDGSVERLLIQFSKSKKEPCTDEIVIYQKDSDEWHQDFIAMTKDFYLDM